MGYNVLVAVEVLEERTAGGLILPERHKDREDAASEKGRLVGVSPMAFQGGDWTGINELPRIGDVVLFQRYAGSEVEGEDGRKYRIMPDTDLRAVVEDDNAH